MKKLIACYTNAKACSKQIVQSSFADILSGIFSIPTQKEMEQSLKSFIEYDFDEHQTMSKVIGGPGKPGIRTRRKKAKPMNRKRRSYCARCLPVAHLFDTTGYGPKSPGNGLC